MSHAADLLLRGVSLRDGRTADVSIRDGHIGAVTGAGTSTPGTGTVLELAGYLLLPAPAEPHAHLDKAYSARDAPNPGGDLAGAVEAWLRYRPTLSQADFAARAGAAVRSNVANGATAIRTHVDVAVDIELRAVHALIQVRADLAALCDLQIVAFAGTPLSGREGARNRALLRESLAAGADVAGGCPALDPDPAACIAACIEAAADHASPIDLHIDEALGSDPSTLSLLADAVRATAFPYGVNASHCVSLGMTAPDVAREIADRVAAAGITVICLPPTNLFLQGRAHPVATPRGLTALRTLRAAGVTVAAGGDNLQDPFNPLGRADPLDTAALLVLAGHDPVEMAYGAVSTAARRALGLDDVDIVPGAPAELLAIRATSVGQAIAQAAADRIVVHTGRIVARTHTTREFLDPDADRFPTTTRNNHE